MSSFQKAILIIIVLLIAGWFLWFQYRPTKIKSACTKEAMLAYLESVKSADARDDTPNNGLISAERRDRLRKYMDQDYELCLHE